MAKKHYNIDNSVISGGDIMDIIEPLWYGVSIYDGEEVYEEALSRFTPAQKYVHAMMWYSCEVYNGGHDQFFFNSTGIVWKNALKGFETIGFDEAADILRCAAEIMGGSPSLDRSTRQEQLDSLNDDECEALDALDSRFYDIENFEDVIMDYINKNLGDFYFDGEIELLD